MKTFRTLLLLLALVTLVGCEEAIINPTPTSPSQATLVVVNDASASVYFMYISPCSSATWGNDRLGSSETIPPGNSRRWAVSPGCYDVRAEFSEGSVAQDRLQLNAGMEVMWRVFD